MAYIKANYVLNQIKWLSNVFEKGIKDCPDALVRDIDVAMHLCMATYACHTLDPDKRDAPPRKKPRLPRRKPVSVESW